MKKVLLLLAALFVVTQAQAQTLIPIVASRSSSDYNSNWQKANAYDGTIAKQWMNGGNSDNEGKDDTPWISFFFGGDAPCDIGTMTVWNFWDGGGGNNLRGIGTVEIFISTDTHGDFSNYDFDVSLGLYKFDITGGVYWSRDEPSPQMFTLNVEATAVKFKILTNWYGESKNAQGIFYQGTSYSGTWANQNIVGLAEVQFHERIPEPATMSLLALGGLALLRRRR